MMQHIRKIKAR
jgi:tubulin monoglycylase TTLL3/8